MTPHAYAPRTLAEMASPQSDALRYLALAAAVAFGACVLTLSAKVQVPFWPVPMTMQTLVVVMLGMAYGSRLGAATVLAYLAAGAAGLPVFAGTPERGLGLAYMMGPTGGFLVGFLVAAWTVGALAERGWDKSFLRCALAAIAGHAIILVSGLLWLGALLGTAKAVEVGLLPFLASTALKTALNATAIPMIWMALDRRGQGAEH